MKKLVGASPDVPEMIELGRREGYRTLFEDGLDKALQGLTTIDEVLRTTSPGQASVEIEPPPTDMAPRTRNHRPRSRGHCPGRTGEFVNEPPPSCSGRHAGVYRYRTAGFHGKTTRWCWSSTTSREILVVLSRTLERENMTVFTASNGVEGLSKADELHPDLIITDYKMPVMDGYALVPGTENPARPGFHAHNHAHAPGDEVESEVAVLNAGARTTI